jgi:hypothetical protein
MPATENSAYEMVATAFETHVGPLFASEDYVMGLWDTAWSEVTALGEYPTVGEARRETARRTAAMVAVAAYGTAAFTEGMVEALLTEASFPASL